MTAAATEEFPRDACPSCRAPIIWCVTNVGRKIPVDYAPHVQGNVSISRQPYGLLATVVSAKLAFGRKDLRLAHRASCKNPPSRRDEMLRGRRG